MPALGALIYTGPAAAHTSEVSETQYEPGFRYNSGKKAFSNSFFLTLWLPLAGSSKQINK